MIKMSVFNKTNDVLIVDTFKNVFQRRNSEVFKPDVPEFETVQKYMLHCQYSVALCTCGGPLQKVDMSVKWPIFKRLMITASWCETRLLCTNLPTVG